MRTLLTFISRNKKKYGRESKVRISHFHIISIYQKQTYIILPCSIFQTNYLGFAKMMYENKLKYAGTYLYDLEGGITNNINLGLV